ncbi:ABC transporter permease [Salinisphaera sp. T31B1]|uniref:ABC transporter permease n=1 Tax=Salinisphaera sp. T31B1 TaxID=727963 RepID=UPI00333F2757
MADTIKTRTTVALLVPLGALLLAMFLWPLGYVGWTSFYDGGFTTQGYAQVLTSGLIRKVAWNTLSISLWSTAVALLLGYALAMHITRMPRHRRAPYLVMVMLPFWTSILVKSFALTVVLGDQGFVTQLLRWLSGGYWHPQLMFNRFSVVVGMTNYLLPFMVLPVMASLESQDANLERAARIMGAGPLRIFFRVTLPLSLPGVFAGILMCLTLSMGMYITPALLGGSSDMMLSNLIDFYTRQSLDWVLATSIAMMLLLISAVLMLLLVRAQASREVAR